MRKLIFLKIKYAKSVQFLSTVIQLRMSFPMSGGDNKILTNIVIDEDIIECKIQINIKQIDFQTLHKLFFRELENVLDLIPDNWNIDLWVDFKEYNDHHNDVYDIDEYFPESKLTTDFKNKILFHFKAKIFNRYEGRNYENITVEITGNK